VFDLSNAQVAKILGAKVHHRSRGAASANRFDEVSLNRALFEREGVEIIGVILTRCWGPVGFRQRICPERVPAERIGVACVIPHHPSSPAHARSHFARN